MTPSSPSPTVASSSNDYRAVHKRRHVVSLEWLAPHLGKHADVLELGGASPFTALLTGRSKAVGICADDLRYPLAMRSGFWDVVLCMEVIEHVADTDGFHTEWQGDGVRMMLSEAFRLTKPGGIFFLTTPNAVSLTAVHHALGLAPPMIYRPHVREYAPYEVDEMVRAAGFVIERRETLDVWQNAITPVQQKRLANLVYQLGYPTELRGEDIFLLARRPF